MKRGLIALMTLYAGSTSCHKDFLDVPDKAVLLEQAYVTDLTTMEHFLNGIYVITTMDFFYGTNVAYPELIADNMKLAPGKTFLRVHYDWNQQADNEVSPILLRGSNMNPQWYNGYRIARYSSFVIEDIGKYKTENILKANDIQGQAYAIRALVHFIMVNTFAQHFTFTTNGSHPGIPYVASSDWRASIPRKTVREIYSHVVDDLNRAIGLLPDVNLSTIRFNKLAAKALLARVYLFMEDYNSARVLAGEVIREKPMMTGPAYPAKLFTLQETEALFQLHPSQVGVNGSAGNYSTTFLGGHVANPNLNYSATNDVAAVLNEDSSDIRTSWISKSGALWLIKKFPSNVIPNFSNANNSYFPTILRSSEMYLTIAECFAHLNLEDSSRIYLDAVRIRASPNTGTSTAVGTALLDLIYRERRKELCFEGLRMYDIQRWKQAVNRADTDNPASQNLSYPNNKSISPIPHSEVELGGLQQNPDY